MQSRPNAAQRAKIRRATRFREPDPSEQPGELNIVPLLDIVVNVMLFLLATTAAVIATAEVGVELPSTCQGTGCHGAGESLGLSVTVTDEAIFVAARGGRLSRDCEDVGGEGATIAGHDFAALGACLARVHAQFPDETSLILSADPAVPFEELVQAMDAARGTPEAPLFPEIRLSAGVR